MKSDLIQRYHQINRYATLCVVGLVIVASVILWRQQIIVEGRTSVYLGLVMMACALLIFQLPRLSFLIWKRRFRIELSDYQNFSWKQFREELNRGI